MKMTYKYSEEELAVNINGQRCYLGSSLASLCYVVKEFIDFATFEDYFKKNGYNAYL